MRRERTFSSCSVFTAAKLAPWDTRVERARRPMRTVYQSRMPGFGSVGLKLVQSGWKK